MVLQRHEEQIGLLGTWELLPEDGSLRWSDDLFRIFDLEPGAIEPTPEFVLSRTHPVDRDRVARVVERAITHGDQEVVDYRIVRDDGEVRHVRSSIAVADDGADAPRRLVGSVQDLTAWWNAHRGLTAHHAVLRTVDGWRGLQRDGRALLEGIAAPLEASSATLLVPRDERLAVRVVWTAGDSEAGPLPGSDREVLARRAMRERRPLEDGRSAVVPILDRDAALGVVELRGCAVPLVGESMAMTMTGLGYELGHFFARRRSELDGVVLGAREAQVLALAARGLPVAAIADHLHVSPSTVKRAFEATYAQLGVSDRAAAVAAAMRTGLIA